MIQENSTLSCLFLFFSFFSYFENFNIRSVEPECINLNFFLFLKLALMGDYVR